MKLLVLASLLVVIFGFCQDTTGEKPIMFPARREMEITERDELRIACYSEGAKLRFSYPENTLLIPRSKHEILQTEVGNYTFLRSSPVIQDTGWYACAEEGVEIDNSFKNLEHTHEDIRWIYIHVNEDVEYSFEEFLDPNYSLPNTIIVVPGHRVVVPCRPVTPSDYMELWMNFKYISRGETMSYDPQIGFVIKEVVFEAGEAILQCVHHDPSLGFVTANYILQYSATTGPKPRMITAGEELILQEGNELKIECHGETKLTFLFPKVTPPLYNRFEVSVILHSLTPLGENTSATVCFGKKIAFHGSEYEIVTNKNGTNTFLRHRATSNDTGWYGCTAEDIENRIPDWSINYTRTEISWIYVYVNSSIPILSGSQVFDDALEDTLIIPCRPTSPGVHMELEAFNPDNNKTNVLTEHHGIDFDSKFGFVSRELGYSRDGWIFHCKTEEPVHYRSETYEFATQLNSTLGPPAITGNYHVSDSKDSFILMTGEDLRLLCEAFASYSTVFRLKWTVPRTVSKNRVQYNLTRTYGPHGANTLLFGRREKLMMAVKTISESDSGVYTCLLTNNPQYEGKTTSRHVEVFDRNGERYLKLGKQGGVIQVIGLEGETVKWLLDLADFPFAKIDWYDESDHTVTTSNKPDDSKFITNTISKEGKPLKLFAINNLKLKDSGTYHLLVKIGNGTKLRVSVILKVQAPPTASIFAPKQDFYLPGEYLTLICVITGTPDPTATFSFLECPKIPSHKDCTRVYHRIFDYPSGIATIFLHKITRTSGIAICEAYNIAGYSKDTEEIIIPKSREPYFTSTNMNHSEIILSLEADENKTLTLECYVNGWLDVTVTWFKNNESLEQSSQFHFADDNRELSILYFFEGDGGRYRCRAENEYGKVENYIDITIQGTAPDVTRTSLIATTALLLAVIFGSALVIRKLHREASRRKLIDAEFAGGALNRLNPDLSVNDQTELLPYDEKWEFPRELLTLDKILGSGAFGIVRKAEARSICRGEAVTTVAVKLVRCTARLNVITALSRELKILVHLGKHPNIVNLLGACTKNVSYGELFLIVEFCRFGNLRDYLVRRRDDFIDEIHPEIEEMVGSSLDADRRGVNDRGPSLNATNCDGSSSTEDCGRGRDSPSTGVTNDDRVRSSDSGDAPDWRSKYEGDYTGTTFESICIQDLVYWSWQVSRGMEYLGKRKVLHGDLAARNVLFADKGVVKICDFGLSKALWDEASYRGQGEDPLPIKWVAVEAIKDRVFSVQTDVWSFGILMWEFFTLAKTPYPGIKPRDLYQKLVDGHRMGQPEYATRTIYDMMLRCWETNPSNRPSFTSLVYSLVDLLDESYAWHYFELNPTYFEMNADFPETENTDYPTLLTAQPPNDVPDSTDHELVEMVNLPPEEAANPL